MIRIIFGSLVLASLATAAAQDTKDAPAKNPAAKGPDAKEPAKNPSPLVPAKGGAVAVEPRMIEVHFRDGCVLRLVVQSEKLEIATSYGPLTVPIKDVQAIEFGLRFPLGVAARIDAAVLKLGSNNFKERDQAVKMLVDWGPLAYPAALAARRSQDLEIAQRAKDVIKQIQAKHPKKDLRNNVEDQIVTRKFTIVGHISTPSLMAATDLFGVVELSLAKMKNLRELKSAGGQREVAVSVDAAKYANQGQWLETEFESDGQTKVVITAKGVVDLHIGPSPWNCNSAGAYEVTIGKSDS